MAGARLYVRWHDDDGSIDQAPPSPSAQIGEQIAGGADGEAAVLLAFGTRLTHPGEGCIAVRPNNGDPFPCAREDGHDWRVLSVSEVSASRATKSGTRTSRACPRSSIAT